MKKSASPRTFQRTFYLLALTAFLLNGCSKEKERPAGPLQDPLHAQQMPDKASQGDRTLTKVMTVAQLRTTADGTTQVLFNENAQVLTAEGETLIQQLKQHFDARTPVNVVYNPWEGKVTGTTLLPANFVKKAARPIESRERAMKIDLDAMDATLLDDATRLGVLNTTTPGLVNVIPDMATAQLIFNYITQQCCAIPGPYEIDQCISFQYAYDGCYARAHKMCWILNTKYRYATNKIFSFANAGPDVLSVQAQKWGGCCVNWWYHVAPLVNIQTPSGVKAYVFDAAMFNQPVLLSTWLHAQKHPACNMNAAVSMINLQPTSSYAPADYSGFSFYPDPFYWDTDNTLSDYSGLTTCW